MKVLYAENGREGIAKLREAAESTSSCSTS